MKATLLIIAAIFAVSTTQAIKIASPSLASNKLTLEEQETKAVDAEIEACHKENEATEHAQYKTAQAELQHDNSEELKSLSQAHQGEPIDKDHNDLEEELQQEHQKFVQSKKQQEIIKASQQ